MKAPIPPSTFWEFTFMEKIRLRLASAILGKKLWKWYRMRLRGEI